jgi:hypothetical protein
MPYSDLNGKKQQLIRKSLAGSFYLGAYSVTAVTALTDTDGDLLALPVGMRDAGHFTDDGLRFPRSVEQSEITSFGENSATRVDPTSDTETIEVDFQETNKLTISLATGVAEASLVPDVTSAELKVPKPGVASAARYFRALAIAVDGPPEAEIYIARFYPRIKITDFAEQAFSKGDEALQWGFTFQAFKDSVLGYDLCYYFAGPGWEALKADMGWT